MNKMLHLDVRSQWTVKEVGWQWWGLLSEELCNSGTIIDYIQYLHSSSKERVLFGSIISSIGCLMFPCGGKRVVEHSQYWIFVKPLDLAEQKCSSCSDRGKYANETCFDISWKLHGRHRVSWEFAPTCVAFHKMQLRNTSLWWWIHKWAWQGLKG